MTENEVGSALVPLYAALKPICAVPPAPRLPFHDSLVAVTSLPLWLHRADQPWVMVWLPAKENRRVQSVIGSPRLVRVMFAVKPLPQSLVV